MFGDPSLAFNAVSTASPARASACAVPCVAISRKPSAA